MPIREARKSMGMKQRELAAKIGIKPTTLSDYETGYRKPSLAVLVRLARVCGRSLDDLVDKDSIA